MRTLLFLDTETSGLDPLKDQLLEVSWATLLRPEPQTLVIPHDPSRVSDEAAAINGYHERNLADSSTWATAEQLGALLGDLRDVTLVGANPSFDAGFLRKAFGMNIDQCPWHYRMLDIESMAYGKLDLDDVPGMKTIFDVLTGQGFVIPEPDHTAAGDVRALVAVYGILKYL